MGWIKRNLFFTIGGAIALILLGVAGYYVYQGWSSNSAATQQLDASYDTLKNLSQQKLAPEKHHTNYTEVAKSQEAQIQAWIKSAKNYFQPVASIPPDHVTDSSFASALRQTIGQLRRDAEAANVTLPPQYDFSFKAESDRVVFAPGSLEPLAAQLGEVKAIAEIVFAARVNSLDGIQRARVSTDDLNGPQADYTGELPTTNDAAVMTPYIVTFRSFTPELSRIITAFASSTNAFLIKAINVEPASMANTTTTADMPYPGMQPGAAPGNYPYNVDRYPRNGRYAPPGYTPPGAVPVAVAGRGGLQTVLKEQLLRITIEVKLVKLMPKS